MRPQSSRTAWSGPLKGVPIACRKSADKYPRPAGSCSPKPFARFSATWLSYRMNLRASRSMGRVRRFRSRRSRSSSRRSTSGLLRSDCIGTGSASDARTRSSREKPTLRGNRARPRTRTSGENSSAKETDESRLIEPSEQDGCWTSSRSWAGSSTRTTPAAPTSRYRIGTAARAPTAEMLFVRMTNTHATVAATDSAANA
jgi:hypothetical protein